MLSSCIQTVLSVNQFEYDQIQSFYLEIYLNVSILLKLVSLLNPSSFIVHFFPFSTGYLLLNRQQQITDQI